MQTFPPSHLMCLRQELLVPALPEHNGKSPHASSSPCQPWACIPVLGQLGLLQAASHPPGYPMAQQLGIGARGAHREIWSHVWADTR